mmetsp:Transcript_36756/g.111095  ORF Transcript_36756/g.111095 Transcript_36756/m.111095 type:complete len:222 (+) Transcript_36756:372-1037(+)
MAAAASPSVATRDPDSKDSTKTPSAMTSFCLPDSPSKRAIESRNFLFSEYCRCAFSCSTLCSEAPLAPQQPLSSVAVTEAVRGHWYSKARPPNAMPLPKVLVMLSLTVTDRVPSCTTKKVLPTSPCLTIGCSALNSKNSIVCKTVSILSSSSMAQTRSCFMAVRISSRVPFRMVLGFLNWTTLSSWGAFVASRPMFTVFCLRVEAEAGAAAMAPTSACPVA